MIQHLVLFHFKEEADGRSKRENMQMAKEKALCLKESIPEIRSLEIYFTAKGVPEHNADFILVSTFDSMERLQAYQAHPAHVAFGKFITPLRETRDCMDYEV